MPSINRAALLSRLPSFAQFAALLLLAWVLAHWTWVFVTPRQQSGAASATASFPSKLLAEKVVAFRLFGGALQAANDSPAAPAQAPSNISIKGLYAARDGRSGFAVLSVDGHTVSTEPGKEIAPGMTLWRVYSDRVEIRHDGRIETVRMAPSVLSAPGAAPSAAGAPGGAATLQVKVQELDEGRFGLSRAELLGTLRKPDQLPLLGRFGPHPRGGAVLEQSPVGGLPEKLGLKVGDVVTGVNGKPLAGLGDVVRVYEQLVQSENVTVDVLRAGQKMSIGIEVAP
jgi:type II secretory pathway component PulC